MSVLTQLAIDRLSPARLWASLDPETRLLAARSLYRHDWGQAPTRREADLAIASGMRFRDTMVRQLPGDKRAMYLAKNVFPTESLAGSLLLALHLEERRELLSAFLDALGVPHENGLIAEDHEMQVPSPQALEKAAAALFAKFDPERVEIYLASLLAMDTATWGGLSDVLTRRQGGPATA